MTETPQDPYQPHPHPQPTVSSYDTQQLPHVAYQRAVAPPAPIERKRRPGAFAAAVVAAALVVGAGAGVGGAAVWTSQNDADTTSSSASPSTSPVVDTPAAASGDGSIENVAQTVLPSVVKIDVSGAQGQGSGSGIILTSDGQILTNNHVVEVAGDSGELEVSFDDGTHAKATIVGTDPLTDTAVIQAEGVSGLTPVTIGSSDSLQVGQAVVAIGSPFGLDATVTTGIVSALKRPVNVGSDGSGNSTVYPAIQTDAAINPGNSGGPLVDLNGHLVGINASIRTSPQAQGGGEPGSIGLGFAIPIDAVLPVIEQMEKGETPTHARLGISVENVAAGDGALVADGARINEVNTDSAAASAGLADGDVITKVDDTLITDADGLVATVRSYRPGDEVTVTYTRDGKEDTVTLTLDSDASATNS
ncbi:MAG TPA: trypsin-like peptidase domain-containing protein [Nocardioides sp.]|nr:trypsin-like peptidase domain-containing protein [Nocardioides sp.]